MPLPLLAIPVLHSSGAWIAYAGSGYVAGTLSSSWVGAFILGNSSLLAGAGLVSGASIAAASGVLAGFGASAGMALGSALTAVGLGGMASWLGLAPVVTFLGLTPVGWAMVGGATVVLATLSAVFTRQHMNKLNAERAKGGLSALSIRELISEIQSFESDAVRQVLLALSENGADIILSVKNDEVTIAGTTFSIKKLRYRIKKDGTEDIGYFTWLGRFMSIYKVKASDSPERNEPAQA